MLRNEIIDKISSDADFKRICKKIAGESFLGDDLYQEVMLTILEYKPTDLERIYNGMQNANEIKFFLVRIATNMAHNAKSRFNKLFLSMTVNDDNFHFEVKEPIETLSARSKENIFNAVENEMDCIRREYGNEFPMDVLMMEAFLQHGSLGKLSDATGIPKVSIHRHITRVKKRIQSNVNLSDFTD